MALTDPTKLWFSQLQKIQGRMKTLNHLTDSGLKKFALQKLGDLLLTDVMKGNLSQFCQNAHIGLVPNTAFNDGTKTFEWFLNRISFAGDEAILTLCYAVAAKHKPELLDKPPTEVAKMTLDAIYGAEPLTTNAAKKDLDQALKDRVPKDFYPSDGSLLSKSPSPKLSATIDSIFS